MLYIDQPVQVGFSYDELVPSILDFLSGTIAPISGSQPSNATAVTGILPSQNPGSAANTTANAARMLWQFTQIWMHEFPEHESSDDRISVWANSYGGHWGPGTMAYFQSQNEEIGNGTLIGTLNGIHAKHMHLDTLGITNGCIDSKIEVPFYLEYASNNTYDLQTMPENIYLEAQNNLTKEGGCYDLIDQCRTLAVTDPENVGTNETINGACSLATLYCFQYVQGAYTERSPFDISREQHSVFPHDYIIGYMNQDWVQKELGVPLNFSLSSNGIVNTFFGVTGDPFKVTIDTINCVAQSGIKVALVFGDRDYRCNWLGGEAISLAMSHPSASEFRSAGYEHVSTNSTYRGGVVRQHNKFSFSRVFDAGHAVGAYQPETVSKIFDRVMFDKDVATGGVNIVGDSSYYSTGPESSFEIKNVLPPSPKNECYLWDAVLTCTDEELLALANSTAVVKDYILVSS